MGFYSADCKGCGHSVRHDGSVNSTSRWMTQAVVVSSDGDVGTGEYDGYGSVMPHNKNADCYALQGKEVWHRACWEIAGKPEFTGASRSAYDQGHFVGDNNDPTQPTTKAEMDALKVRAEIELEKYRADMAAMLDGLKKDGEAQ